MKKFKTALAISVVTVLIICITQVINIEPKNQISTTDAQSTTTEPNKTIIVNEIQKLAKLETVSMNIEQIIQGSRNQKDFWGAFGESTVFVAYGSVVAGIDLGKFSKDDITKIDSTAIEINLPPAEIFHVIIDNQKSYIASRNKGIFAVTDRDMETQLRRQAQIDFEKNALDLKILEQASINAQEIIKKLLQDQGFSNFSFTNSQTVTEQKTFN